MPVLSINVPTKKYLNCKFVQCLLHELPQIKGYTISIRFLEGKSNLDQARSICLTNWYDSSGDDDLFIFIDADQTFKVEDLNKMISLIKEDKADVSCAGYSRIDGTSTLFVMNPEEFYTGRDNKIRFGATGFMMISRPILHNVYEWIKKNDYPESGTNGRFCISPEDSAIIPFFRQRLIKENDSFVPAWVGEDYSFCWLIRQCGGTIRGFISPSVGHEVSVVRTLRTTIEEPVSNRFTISSYIGLAPSLDTPMNLTITPPTVWGPKSVVYFTGQSVEQWTPDSLETGIGGSETAVINLSREWVKLGYTVTVFSGIETEKVFGGVNYFPWKQFKGDDTYNILILWRGGCSTLLDIPLKAKKILYDLHDLSNVSLFTESRMNRVNFFFVKSAFHRSHFKFPEDKVKIIPNGGTLEYLPIQKKPYKLIWTSSYDRGLYHILKHGFPLIKQEIPEAELHVYYGWDSFDKFPQNESKRVFKETMNKLFTQPGVIHHGRVGQSVLHRAMAESQIHYYVGDFNEIDCISVRESASLGTIPFVSKIAAFDNESRDYYFRVTGDPTTEIMQTSAASAIITLLRNQDHLKTLSEKLRNSVVLQSERWDSIAKRWAEYFDLI